jgi:hypothetical protein
MTQWPQPSADDLTAAYEDVEDPLYMAERENRYHTFRKVVRQLDAAEGRRLLDAGAYCGYFVDVAREAGFQAEGLELSRWASDQARDLGLTVHNETIATRAASGESYDIVTMWDVIEHLGDPRKELEHLHSLLVSGGKLYVSTIDAGGLVARALGPRWPWLMDMHLHYFDRRTLPMLLDQVGFRVTGVGRYTYHVSARYFVQKAGASFRVARPLAAVARRLTPRSWRLPITWDNMLVTAEKP